MVNLTMACTTKTITMQHHVVRTRLMHLITIIGGLALRLIIRGDG